MAREHGGPSLEEMGIAPTPDATSRKDIARQNREKEITERKDRLAFSIENAITKMTQDFRGQMCLKFQAYTDGKLTKAQLEKEMEKAATIIITLGSSTDWIDSQKRDIDELQRWADRKTREEEN